MLPESEISEYPEIKKIFQELKRRYIRVKHVEPMRPASHLVGAPLKETAYDQMDYDNWLSSFKKYNRDMHFFDEPGKGSLHENARKFEEYVSKHPARFLHFIEKIMTEDIAKEYILSGMEGLVKGNADP